MVSHNNFANAANNLDALSQKGHGTQLSNSTSGHVSSGKGSLNDAITTAALDLTSAADQSAQVVEPVNDTSATQLQGAIELLSWWTLKNKATLLAVALGTVPVLIVGGISTFVAGRQLSQEVIGQQQQFTNAIALQLQDFGNRPKLNQTTNDTARDSLSQMILNDAEIDTLSAIVNQRIDNLRQGTSSENNALRLNVIDESRNNVLISNDQADINTAIDARFPGYSELKESEAAVTFEAISTEDNRPYLITYAPVAKTSTASGNDLGVLVYQPMAEAFSAQQSLVLTLLGGTILTTLLVSTLAAYLANRATQPIIAASKAVEKLGQGKFATRLQEEGNDELTLLNSNINVMAEQLEYQLEFIQETAHRQGLFQRQATLAEQQQRQNEVLQRGLVRLIQLVEDASDGNLSARMDLTDKDIANKEIFTLANAFNSVLARLQEIVAQAKTTTSQISSTLDSDQSSFQTVADSVQAQVASLTQTLPDVEKMADAISEIETQAQQAEKVSKQTEAIAHKSLQTAEDAAHSISDLRANMTETTSKVKQLSTASQQISQVISLINEIALKTNLLAVNASIETNASKQESEAVKTLADKIGQLSEQSTRATGEIERIVHTIQSNSKEIIASMKTGTAQMVEGQAKLDDTQNGLSEIVETAAESSNLTRSLAEASAAQVETSRRVAGLMVQMQADSQQTAQACAQVNNALQSTAAAAQKLAASTEPFEPLEPLESLEPLELEQASLAHQTISEPLPLS